MWTLFKLSDVLGDMLRCLWKLTMSLYIANNIMQSQDHKNTFWLIILNPLILSLDFPKEERKQKEMDYSRWITVVFFNYYFFLNNICKSAVEYFGGNGNIQ